MVGMLSGVRRESVAIHGDVRDPCDVSTALYFDCALVDT